MNKTPSLLPTETLGHLSALRGLALRQEPYLMPQELAAQRRVLLENEATWAEHRGQCELASALIHERLSLLCAQRNMAALHTLKRRQELRKRLSDFIAANYLQFGIRLTAQRAANEERTYSADELLSGARQLLAWRAEDKEELRLFVRAAIDRFRRRADFGVTDHTLRCARDAAHTILDQLEDGRDVGAQ